MLATSWTHTRRSTLATVSAAGLLGVVVLSGCASVPVAETASNGGQTSTSASAGGAQKTVTVRPDQRLTELPAKKEQAALGVIGTLTVTDPDYVPGYDRDNFGPSWTDSADGVLWAGDGCYTRDNILFRDLDNPTKRDDCVVVAGTLDDPYTGKILTFNKAQASAVQIDHMVPLLYAWRNGAADWDKATRARFGNDPLNLVAVDGPANGQKSADGPGEWMPTNPAIRCAYALRFATVATTYNIAVSNADKTAMTQACGG